MTLRGEAESDEVYITAGHNGHPDVAAQLGRAGRRRKLRGRRGRDTLESEKPPVLGSLQRSNVNQVRRAVPPSDSEGKESQRKNNTPKYPLPSNSKNVTL